MFWRQALRKEEKGRIQEEKDAFAMMQQEAAAKQAREAAAARAAEVRVWMDPTQTDRHMHRLCTHAPRCCHHMHTCTLIHSNSCCVPRLFLLQAIPMHKPALFQKVAPLPKKKDRSNAFVAAPVLVSAAAVRPSTPAVSFNPELLCEALSSF
eukprot:COSAG05_NODE_3029_length_2405_cov_18.605831_4_plen_152_part_00